jgi:hypothetical protein
MSLAWHVAKKDLRRLALPVAVWVALIVLPTLAFRLASPPIEPHMVTGLDVWRKSLGIWIQLLLGIEFIIGYVLAGSLVLEDPLVDSNAFWPTRPIAKRTLLAAKLLAAAVLFLVAPILALTPLWLGSGFGGRDLGWAAWQFATAHGGMIALALMTGSLVRNLAQHLGCTLLFIAAIVATQVVSTPLWQPGPPAVLRSRVDVATAVLIATGVIALVHQFLTRRRPITWSLLVAGWLVAVTVRCVWPWDLARHESAASTTGATAERLAAVAVDPTFTQLRKGSREVPNLFGTTAWDPTLFYVPVLGHSASDRSTLYSGSLWRTEAGRRLLGVGDSAKPLRWQMMMYWESRRDMIAENPEFEGSLEIWAVRPRQLWELPVRVDAKRIDGSTRLHVMQLFWTEDRLDDIYIEERDTAANSVDNWREGDSIKAPEKATYIDQFFVVNRTTNEVRAAYPRELGSLTLNGLAVRYRMLGVTWQRAWGEPVLVKIRFECAGRFQRPVAVHGIKFAHP